MAFAHAKEELRHAATRARPDAEATSIPSWQPREIITDGSQRSFWADISHRCMSVSWPAFIAGAAFVFVTFNAAFAVLYWIGDDPISNVPHRV
jgi:hypothetical protein